MYPASAFGCKSNEEIAGLMQRSLVVQAYSKINLRLKIVGRQDDGYHLLSMINCTTDLSDQLELRLDESGEFSLDLEMGETCAPYDGAALHDLDDNLAVRAARTLMKAASLPFGARIRLIKRVPIGAGLGGGSADAAALLRLLTGAMFRRVDSAVMNALALSLGADVPYLIHGGLAAVGGVGESVRRLDCAELKSCQALIFVPETRLSTAAVYERERARRREYHSDQALTDKTQGHVEYRQLCGLVTNDLSASATEAAPELADLLRIMGALPGVGAAGLSGSGSALFALPSVAGPISQRLHNDFIQALRPFSGTLLRVNFLPNPAGHVD